MATKKRRLRAKNRMGIVVPFDVSADDVTLGNGMSLQEYIDSLPAQSGGSTVRIDDSGDYVDLIIEDNTPVISVSANALVMGGATKTATFKVSGRKLRGNISLNVSGGNFSLSKNSITPVDGTVAETTITVTYNGTATATASITISSAGATAKTVTAQYTEQQVPTISVEETPLSFKAAAGETQQKTLSVSGVNLEAAIAAAIEGTNADKFTVSPASISQSGGSSSGTLTITYTPGVGASGTHTATLKLTTTNGQTKSITLNGAVSALTVSPASLSFNTDQGGRVTEEFRVTGENLAADVTLELTDSNNAFALSAISLTKSQVENGGATVTVTYNPSTSGTHNASVAISSSGASQTLSLNGTAAPAAALDSNGRFIKDGIYYGAESDGNGGWTDNVKVYNTQYKTTGADTSNGKYSGVLNIPSTVTALKGGVETQFTVIGVAEYAFRGNTAITSITLPDTVTSMAPHILLGCTGLTYFNMGNGVTGLPYDFGNGLTALQELVIGDSIVDMKVNGSPFNGCSALRTVTLGSSVQRIGQLLDSSFANGVTTIICRGTLTKPVVNKASLGSTSYKISNAANITVYIPSGTKSGEDGYLTVADQQSNVISGYSSATIWKYFDDNNRLIEQ